MSGTLNLNCPSCAGTLPPPMGSRKVSCKYCGKTLYYKAENFIPRYMIPARKQAEDVRRDTEMLFNSHLVKEGLKESAVLVSRRRRFVPLYFVSGKRGGVMETGKERVIYKETFDLPENGGNSYSTPYRKQKTEIVREEDSRVVLGDFRYIYEAARIEEAELAQDSLRESVLANLPKMKPVILQELAVEGEIIAPDIPIERIVEKGVMSAKKGQEALEIIEMDVSIVYYPVEELLFRLKDHFISVTYDLVEGGFLWGRLPCQRKKIVILSFFLAGMLGFFFGKFMAAVLGTFSMARVEISGVVYFGSIVFLFATLVFGGGLNAVFLLFRTPYELKVTPKGLIIAKLGETPQTPLTPFLKGVISIISRGLETALEEKKR
jgi:hypothetical protein